jgi:hypothetical protein
MKTPLFPLLTFLALAAGCSNESDTAGPATNTSSTGDSVVTAPADYLSTVARQKQNAVKTIDVAVVNKAIQQFQVEQGRNPGDLDELVRQKYLPRVPETPFGTKLVYDANTGTARVVKE